jgi:hypothetical protein
MINSVMRGAFLKDSNLRREFLALIDRKWLRIKLYRPLFPLAALLCLIACSVIPNQNQDPIKNNRDTFRKDLRECQEDYPEISSGLHVRQWQGCMNLKGWK